jgi:biopolymer transport protein ExbB
MKKLIALLTVAGILSFGLFNVAFAQDGAGSSTTTEKVAPAVEKGFHQVLKEEFISGGAGFMGIILLTLVFGLAISIERLIYLNLSTTNTKKLLNKVESALQNGGIDAAKDVCKATPGPVASIFWEGLNKYKEGLDVVEKSIVSLGGVLMGRLEKGLSWVSLFIALAPMLGFMGTVVGMIGAFKDIAAAGNISATIVAQGIQVALLTTVFGLIVAIILQVFYNYFLAKIDSIVNDMEDSTIDFIDILTHYKSGK